MAGSFNVQAVGVGADTYHMLMVPTHSEIVQRSRLRLLEAIEYCYGDAELAVKLINEQAEKMKTEWGVRVRVVYDGNGQPLKVAVFRSGEPGYLEEWPGVYL